jgi:hypothetical protein
VERSGLSHNNRLQPTPLRGAAEARRSADKRTPMSDNFEMLVDVDVSLADAPDAADAVIAEFQRRGLIVGGLTPDCVLGGAGYRLGPSVHDIYKHEAREGRFWELITSGVEPQVKRTFNHWALGPSCEGFRCPKCSANIEPFDDDFGDVMMIAIDEWTNETGAGKLACPKCKQLTAVTSWHAKPTLGFGNFSIRFWNWPPFDFPGWQLDIPALVREITGHSIVRTYGHI